MIEEQKNDLRERMAAISKVEAEAREEKAKANVQDFLDNHTHPSKDKDELIDIHVGNPLRRITEILEDIKKQKVFSFTLKGSLGIMGIALALSFFGIFGGSKALCDKGVQSFIGTAKELRYLDEGDWPLLTRIADAYSVMIGGRPHEKPTVRLILIQQDTTTIHIELSRALDRGGPIPLWLTEVLAKAVNSVIVTGQYDACSRTLKLEDPTGIEPL